MVINKNKKLAIFDVEGVLIDAEYLPLLAKTVGKEREVWEITKMGLEGKISWEEGLIKRIDILQKENITFQTAISVANSLPYTSGIKEVFKFLQENNFLISAISGGFSLFVNRLKEDFNIDYAFSNELIFENGFLRGVKIKVGNDKSAPLKNIIEKEKISKNNILCVVDGANDLKIFDISGFKIAFCANDIVKQKADAIVDKKDLREIIPLINKNFSF